METILRYVIIAAVGALASILANQSIAVFNDGLRPVLPEYLEKRMDRKALAATSFAIGFGLVIGYGLPTSIAASIILIHCILLTTDIIGTWCPDTKKGMIASGVIGAVYGVALLFGLQVIIDLFNLLPVNFLGSLGQVSAGITLAFAIFPAVTVALQFGAAKGIITAVVTLLVRQIVETYGKIALDAEHTISLNKDGMALLAGMIGARPEQVMVGGNSSLTMMFDILSHAMLDGLLGAEPWVQVKDRKFLCPVPGYDRHFAMTEHFGFQLIPIPMHNDGPDMDMIEDLVQRDASIKGIWCVPKYQNPTGIVFSPMVVERFAHLQPAAPDFRIFWDNAYCVHDLYPNAPAVLPDILSACANAGHPDMVYEFCSTSKVSFPGAGISAVAASSANLIDLRKVWKFATIGPDKLNQLRQARFFRNESGIEAHMARHARLLRPKFEQVISIFREELDGSGIANWTEPRGGYFLSFDTMPGCAARTVELCRRAGVKFTPAGSTWPYGRDPQDSNVRIAPSFASAEEIEPAARLFTICVRLATLEKLAATRFASETALGAERIA